MRILSLLARIIHDCAPARVCPPSQTHIRRSGAACTLGCKAREVLLPPHRRQASHRQCFSAAGSCVCEGVDGVRQGGAVGVFVARDQRAQNRATAHFRHEQAGATRNVSCNQLASGGGSGGRWWLAAVAAATCTPSNRPRDAGVHPRRRAARRWGEGASRRADG